MVVQRRAMTIAAGLTLATCDRDHLSSTEIPMTHQGATNSTLAATIITMIHGVDLKEVEGTMAVTTLTSTVSRTASEVAMKVGITDVDVDEVSATNATSTVVTMTILIGEVVKMVHHRSTVTVVDSGARPIIQRVAITIVSVKVNVKVAMCIGEATSNITKKNGLVTLAMDVAAIGLNVVITMQRLIISNSTDTDTISSMVVTGAAIALNSIITTSATIVRGMALLVID